MIGAAEQLPVEVTCLVVLLALDLEVDVGLPQHLGHVEARLRDGQPVDGARARRVAQDRLQLRVLNQQAACMTVYSHRVTSAVYRHSVTSAADQLAMVADN